MGNGGTNTAEKSNHKMTAAEYFTSVPQEKLEHIAFVLLCFMMTLPLLAAVVPLLATLLSHAFKVFEAPVQQIVIHRYEIMNMAFRGVGYAGLMLGGFSLLWSRYNRTERTAKKSAWEILRDNGTAIFLAAMLIWSIFSTAFSTDPIISLFGDTIRREGLLTYFSYAGVFMLACKLKKCGHRKTVFEIFAGVAAVLAFVDLLNLPLVNAYCYTSKYSSIFINTNHYGYYLCMAAMVSVFLIETGGAIPLRGTFRRTEPTGIMQSMLAVIVHIAEFALICSGLSRCQTLGTLLATAFALLTLLVFVFFVDRAKFRRTVLICLLAAAVITASGGGVWNVKYEIESGTEDINTIGKLISGEHVEQADINKIGSVRGILWVNALKFIGEKPLFGYGADNLAVRYEEVGATNDRPHNELLQFGASLGIPAMLFYILAMVFHLMLFIRNFKHVNTAILCAYCIVLAYLVSSMFGNTMFYTSPYFFAALGISYVFIREVNAKNDKPTAQLAAE